MSNGNSLVEGRVAGRGLTRSDRRRNAAKARLREVVSRRNAILAIDLGEDKQTVAVFDHDTRALARRRETGVRAHQLGGLLEWAIGVAQAEGFCSVTVACEPTGHRWMVLQQLCARRGLGLVCVQPLATHREREREDYTLDKTDDKDTVLIARLVARVDCYLPEDLAVHEGAYARLRHAGIARNNEIEQVTACRHTIADLLGCVWPAVLDAAADPLDSVIWLASLAVVTDRCDGRPERLRRLGLQRFKQAVARELPRWGGSRLSCPRIAEAVYAACGAEGLAQGHLASRAGGLQRAQITLEAWRDARRRQLRAEQLMLAVLDELGHTAIAGSIPGLSLIGAAAILAETGDPARFASPRSAVKHAGLNPAEKTSAKFTGRTHLSRRGRPRLRTAAWRAAWALILHNPVHRARYTHLTTRDTDRLTDGQARAAIAAALIRQLLTCCRTGRAWDPAIAAGTATLPTSQQTAA